MLSYARFYEYVRSQYQLGLDYRKKVQGTCVAFTQDIDKIAADARNKARLLMENYYQELRAATLGDDTMERVQAAWTAYQQECARLNEEYLTSIHDRYQSLAETLPSVQLAVTREALESYIGLLQEVREELAA